MAHKAANINTDSNFTKELNTINDKVLNFAILISFIFAIPWFIIMFFRNRTINLDIISTFQSGVLLFLAILYFTRIKTSFKFRFVAYLCVSSAITFLFALNFGMLGFWGNGIILIATIVSIFYQKKYAFIILGVLTIISIIIAFLFLSKRLVVNFNVLAYVNDYSIWVSMIISLSYISIIIIYTIGLRRSFFVSTIKQLIIEKEKAQKSEQKFKTLFNAISDGIVISDFEGNILEANKALLDFMNVASDNFKNYKVRDFVLPEYHEIIRGQALNLLPDTTMPLLEIQLKNYNNEIVPVELNTLLIDYNNEKAVFSVVRDISGQKKIEQKILSTIIKTEEKERSHLAKELHDGVGPLLSATKIYAKALAKAENEEERVYTITKLNETVDEAILSAQEIANNISPHVLRNFGLKGAIESFYQKINKTSSLTFDFHSNIHKRIDENIETTLYRIVVELINNTIKYADAKIITIVLLIDENKISLNYADNGKGFDLEKTQKQNSGMGLSNIFSRIKSLNGKITMQSKENEGIKINIIIDL